MFSWKALNKKYLKIRLVDKCLILIMAILLVQSAYTLFVNMASSQEVNAIDIIVRTSMAAIFGYFISANFTREYSPVQTKDRTASETPQALEAPPPLPAQEPLSFPYETPSPPLPAQEPLSFPYETPSPPTAQEPRSSLNDTAMQEPPIPKIQILVVTAIGICTLLMLIVFRNFFEHTTGAMGALSQLRDFVSGCVGFLIGSGREDVS